MSRDSKGRFEKGNLGKPKGSKSKFSTDIKQALLEVFERKGGADGLYRWACKNRNETKFYEFIMKLLPKDVSLSSSSGISFADGLKKVGDAIKSNPDLEKKLEDELTD